MDSDDAMVAPAASELVGDELDQDHELCLWGDELGNAHRTHRRARMQLLKLAMAAWNANVLAEMKAIATANDYGIFYDYGCIDGMNGEYPAWETSHENAPPIVTERELLLWGVADQTSCELGQEQSESEQRQRDKCAIEQSMVAAELEAEGYGIFFEYGCIDGMNGEYPCWESQADWHKDTSHENAPPIVIARELLLWGCAKSAGDVDAEQCANYLADQEEYMALHIAHNMAEPPGPEPPSDDGATWQDLYGDSPPGSPAPGSAQFGGGDDFDHHEELQLWGVVLQGAFLLQQEADQHAWEWMNVRAQATLAGIEHQADGEDHDIVAVMEFWGQGMHHPSSPTQHLANVCNCVVANGVAVVCQIHENSEEQVQLFEAYVQSTHLACESHYDQLEFDQNVAIEDHEELVAIDHELGGDAHRPGALNPIWFHCTCGNPWGHECMVHDEDCVEHDRRGARNHLEEVAGVVYLEHCACDASIAYLEEGEGFPEVAARLWQAESPQESLGRAEAEFEEQAVAVAAQESQLWAERWALYAHRVHPTMRCIGCRERLHVAPVTKCAMDVVHHAFQYHSDGPATLKHVQSQHHPVSVQKWSSNGVLLEPHAFNPNGGQHPAPKKDPYVAAMAAKPAPMPPGCTSPPGECWTCRHFHAHFEWKHEVQHHVQCGACCMRYCSWDCLHKNKHDADTCVDRLGKRGGTKRKARWVDYKLVCEAGVTVAVEDPNPNSMAGQDPN